VEGLRRLGVTLSISSETTEVKMMHV
jgi:hypothetical protein